MRLHRALTEAAPRGAALLALREHLDELTNAAQFKSLQKQLPKLRATLNKVRSVTIGINVSEGLEPGSATILSISPEVIKGPASLLGKLLGREAGVRGITPLHVTDWSPRDPLFNDMRNLIEKVVDPVARAIRRFTSVDAGSFSGLEPELSFYLNGVELIRRLRKAALPVCRPEVALPDERVLCLEDGYSISLALQVLSKGADPEAVAADERRHQRDTVRSGASSHMGPDRPQSGWKDDLYAGCGAGSDSLPGRAARAREPSPSQPGGCHPYAFPAPRGGATGPRASRRGGQAAGPRVQERNTIQPDPPE